MTLGIQYDSTEHTNELVISNRMPRKKEFIPTTRAAKILHNADIMMKNSTKFIANDSERKTTSERSNKKQLQQKIVETPKSGRTIQSIRKRLVLNNKENNMSLASTPKRLRQVCLFCIIF
jgi:hypothetical protein